MLIIPKKRKRKQDGAVIDVYGRQGGRYVVGARQAMPMSGHCAFSAIIADLRITFIVDVDSLSNIRLSA